MSKSQFPLVLVQIASSEREFTYSFPIGDYNVATASIIAALQQEGWFGDEDVLEIEKEWEEQTPEKAACIADLGQFEWTLHGFARGFLRSKNFERERFQSGSFATEFAVARFAVCSTIDHVIGTYRGWGKESLINGNVDEWARHELVEVARLVASDAGGDPSNRTPLVPLPAVLVTDLRPLKARLEKDWAHEWALIPYSFKINWFADIDKPSEVTPASSYVDEFRDHVSDVIGGVAGNAVRAELSRTLEKQPSLSPLLADRVAEIQTAVDYAVSREAFNQLQSWVLRGNESNGKR